MPENKAKNLKELEKTLWTPRSHTGEPLGEVRGLDWDDIESLAKEKIKELERENQLSISKLGDINSLNLQAWEKGAVNNIKIQAIKEFVGIC